ncbi:MULTISPECIES: hypothetical protein [Legionella]|uniref:Uncharacterized protein n=2 Tax=Legionella septentrionalis TaxID=2498109 RepID=A0A3S0XUD5_9GAMM|nr:MULTISPECIES: hypothetical protein [Legionella]MCP0913903.1 hypothetical protein [Legionella sp. 27cVA30]RUQ90431.1 hypothetical protein EKM59_02160 [Legionella septentrionalis]RUQ94674.1 hypothetical protein ELY11_10655 [Legionella septentrionalis]RUR10777.1 hypothetical protein ELY14_04360 [Legionella septentrionalis]RUR16469.1 hypothetical protein ELY10_02965 [Legionella septentrionalis]
MFLSEAEHQEYNQNNKEMTVKETFLQEFQKIKRLQQMELLQGPNKKTLNIAIVVGQFLFSRSHKLSEEFTMRIGVMEDEPTQHYINLSENKHTKSIAKFLNAQNQGIIHSINYIPTLHDKKEIAVSFQEQDLQAENSNNRINVFIKENILEPAATNLIIHPQGFVVSQELLLSTLHNEIAEFLQTQEKNSSKLSAANFFSLRKTGEIPRSNSAPESLHKVESQYNLF